MPRSTDARLRRKNKRRQSIDLDSTEDPAPGKQDGVASNGHFAKNCCHPLFGFTNEGDCLEGRLRPGKVHAAAGALEFIRPRYRVWFKLFRFRDDAAFAKFEIYEYCEGQLLYPVAGQRQPGQAGGASPKG